MTLAIKLCFIWMFQHIGRKNKFQSTIFGLEFTLACCFHAIHQMYCAHIWGVGRYTKLIHGNVNHIHHHQVQFVLATINIMTEQVKEYTHECSSGLNHTL